MKNHKNISMIVCNYKDDVYIVCYLIMQNKCIESMVMIMRQLLLKDF